MIYTMPEKSLFLEIKNKLVEQGRSEEDIEKIEQLIFLPKNFTKDNTGFQKNPILSIPLR